MMIRLRDYSHELEQNAIHDQLTGCKNRTALAWAYNNDFDASQSVGIVMCDLNGLKRMNDSKGHLAGDQYICDAAKILCDCFGSENVYRIGGDEFAVVLTGISIAVSSFVTRPLPVPSAFPLVSNLLSTTRFLLKPCSNMPTKKCTKTNGVITKC